MSSIFSKIVTGEIPAYKVAEDEDFLAFLDINPRCKGHTLVIPKREIDYIFDMPDDLLANMMVFAKKVALGLKEAVPCVRVGVAVVGLEVPHAHIHLQPIRSMADFGFNTPSLTFTKEELASLAETIQKKVLL